jgi:penicillin-binding protein 1C
VGRVEGSPRPGAFGINTAAPLLFRIFDLLPQEPPPSPTGKTAGEHRLAPLLRRFSAEGEAALPLEPAGPRIVYPPPGATLDIIEAGGATVPIALEASGGRPPYRWIVNGIPLPNPPIGSVISWVPDGPGFARISVTDSDNRATSEELRLE